MANLLYTVGPLSACMDSSPLQYYLSGSVTTLLQSILLTIPSGILNPSECDPSYIDHCLIITGFGEEDNMKYWKLKVVDSECSPDSHSPPHSTQNSWGHGYGEQGFIRLIRGTGACGINRSVTSVTI